MPEASIMGVGADTPWAADLTGTNDVAGVVPYDELVGNAMMQPVAEWAAGMFLAQQTLPVVNLTFSWAAFDILFAGFFLFAVAIALGVMPLPSAIYYREVAMLLVEASSEASLEGSSSE